MTQGHKPHLSPNQVSPATPFDGGPIDIPHDTITYVCLCTIVIRALQLNLQGIMEKKSCSVILN